MRTEILQAVGLVACLNLAGPIVSPATIGPGDLPEHLGQQVALEGRVVDVDVGETVHTVRVANGSRSSTVLSRAPPPPLGASVRVVGDAASGRRGAVLWTDGPWQTLDAPDPEPVGLATLASRAPRLAGTTVAIVARFDSDALALEDDGVRLPVRVLASAPPEGRVLAWGVLRYVPGEAGYRLDATGWERWNPPSP